MIGQKNVWWLQVEPEDDPESGARLPAWLLYLQAAQAADQRGARGHADKLYERAWQRVLDGEAADLDDAACVLDAVVESLQSSFDQKQIHKIYQETLGLCVRMRGSYSPAFIVAAHNVGELLESVGRPREAQWLRQALRTMMDI